MISLALFEGTNLDNIQDVTVGKNGLGTSITIGEPNNIDSPTIAELLEVQNPRESDTSQVGLNLNYIWGSFEFNVDTAYSEAKDASAGESWLVVRTAIDTLNINWDNGAQVPDIGFGSTELDETLDYGAWFSRLGGDKVKDKAGNFNFDGTFEPDNVLLTKVLFGTGYTLQNKYKTFWKQKNPSAYAIRNNVDPGLINAPESEQFVINGNTLWGPLPASALKPGSFDHFMGNSGANLPNSWAGIDIDGLFDYYRSLDAKTFDEYMVPRPALEGGNTFGVKEETLHLYGEVILEEEIAGMPFLLDLGLRYIDTRVDAWVYTQDVANIAFDPDGTMTEARKQSYLAEDTTRYSKLLPSMNFKLSVTDKVVLRLAASEAISRPPLNIVSPVTRISQDENTLENSLVRHDQTIEPYFADQYDVAVEWYYSDNGTLNFASYYKKLQGFLRDEITQETIAGEPFEVITPMNDHERASIIQGYELSWLQTFDEYLPEALAGFGMSANYTLNDSRSGEFDGKGKELPFRGLSDYQYNIVLFYEQHGLGAYLAYNYRSKYSLGMRWSSLVRWSESAGEFVWDGGFNETVEADDWAALDLGINYKITDNFNLSFDANNLLDPDYVQYLNGNKEHVDYISSWGRSYRVGLRFKF